MNAEHDGRPTGPVFSRRKVLFLAGTGAGAYFIAIHEAVKAYQKKLAPKTSTHQAEGTTSRIISEQERVNHLLALDIMRQFIDISSRAAISELYDTMLKDPAGHIGIADNSGYRDAYYKEGYTYKIFPEEFDPRTPPELLEQYPWSIKIIVRDIGGKPVRARVMVQTNTFGDFYTGLNDVLPSEEYADFAGLAMFSSYIFNLPDGIKGKDDWGTGEGLLLNLEREYLSEEGLFKESLVANGVVSFEAPFPIPNDLNKSAESSFNGSAISNLFQA